MKRLLLTGASGFLGVHAQVELLARGFEVHTAGLTAPSAEAGSAFHHPIDLLDTKQHGALIAAVQPTHLLHLAWAKKPGGAVFNADENYEWLCASLSLARSFADGGGKRLVCCGSSAEYDWNYGYCTEYLTPTLPETTYGACKHALQVAIEALARDRKLSWAWPRVFFCYGPNEPPQRLVPSVILSLLRGEPALCSHGNQMRGYLHVRDVARALAAIADADVQGPINVCSATPTPLKEVVSQIGALLGQRDLIRLGAIPARTNDHPLVLGNNQRLRAEIGWEPRIALADGLLETIRWWQQRQQSPGT
jgi:nucleoside-diphosphate-sugar epimerase